LLLGVTAATFGSILLHHPLFYRRIHRFRWSTVISVGSLVMLLAAAEASVRTFDPFGISHVEESSRLWFDYVSDPDLVFRLPAHKRGTYQGVAIATNALGFRDREIEPRKDGELRILLLGDSITFGYGVPDELTYGRQLESILAAELGRPVRAVNAGMGGYNTVQEYAFLEDYGSTIDPDLVSLLYLPNDIDTNDPPFNPAKAIYGNASKITRLLMDKSWLFRLAIFAASEPESTRVASVGLRTRGAQQSLESLAKMAALCRQRGFRFATFFYREKDESQAATRFVDELFSQVSRVGAENGFQVTDIRPWWGDATRRSVTNSIVDWHPNARGHQILAAGMAKVLMTQGALIEAASSRRARSVDSAMRRGG
jgi:lysophospholipase L1-like esterase